MNARIPTVCQAQIDVLAEIRDLIGLQRSTTPRREFGSLCDRFHAVLNTEGIDQSLVHQNLKVVSVCLRALLHADSIDTLAWSSALSDVVRNMQSVITTLSRSAFVGDAK